MGRRSSTQGFTVTIDHMLAYATYTKPLHCDFSQKFLNLFSVLKFNGVAFYRFMVVVLYLITLFVLSRTVNQNMFVD